MADYRGTAKELLVSYDGAHVQFGYEEWGKFPARFSVDVRTLEIAPAHDAGLSPPITELSGKRITDWKNKVNPELSGIPLKLSQYETSRSLAIAPDGESFLVGADWRLRLFDRHRKRKWNVPVPGVA